MYIGRDQEKLRFSELLYSKKAELIAVYGRRRVGKTFLIREFFKDKTELYFSVTGQHKSSNRLQLEIFREELQRVFYGGKPIPEIATWRLAFNLFVENIERIISEKNPKNIVIFFDELPWLAGKKSGLLEALDHFWNTRLQYLKQVKFIVCGSAATWIIKKIVNAKGGLHNRITATILLEPFTIKEVKEYLLHQGFTWSKQDIIETYMIFGGIPYYLSLLRKSLSLHQNVARLCFNKGELANELDNLYAALFDKGEEYKNIVAIASSNRSGIPRTELLAKIKNGSKAQIYNRLNELEISGFIKSININNVNKKDALIRTVDEFSLFAFKWMENAKNELSSNKDAWLQIRNSQKYKIWCGYAFENLCFKNIDIIKKELGFSAIESYAYPFKKEKLEQVGAGSDGVQIDLVFERKDRVIVLVEIKYRENNFIIDETFVRETAYKTAKFLALTGSKKSVVNAVVSNNEILGGNKVDRFRGNLVNFERFV